MCSRVWYSVEIKWYSVEIGWYSRVWYSVEIKAVSYTHLTLPTNREV